MAAKTKPRYANATAKLRAAINEHQEQAYQAAKGAAKLARMLRIAEDDRARQATRLATMEAQLITLQQACERWGYKQPAAAIRLILAGEA